MENDSHQPNFSDLLNLNDYSDFDGHEAVIHLCDKASGLLAIVAIHNSNLGPALGGTRFKPYEHQQAALQDVLRLSRAMSYKCALANLPYGGGKAVIVANQIVDKSQALQAYARLIEKLHGIFSTGTDVGISDDDVDLMAKETTYMLGASTIERNGLTTSTVAALGVFSAMKAVLNQLYGDPAFTDRTVAIKGVGKLGGELARLVSEAGGRVFVADINQAQTDNLARRLPSVEVIDVNVIHKQEVDIYAPCALGKEFTSQTVEELRCRAVSGGANNQLENDEAGNLLHNRSILYAPDYVANAGGLIYVADQLEVGGFNAQRVLDRTQAVEQTMGDIFRLSISQDLPTHVVADTIAKQKIAGKRGQSA
jgi:valine dehydrogenase (NAD+)